MERSLLLRSREFDLDLRRSLLLFEDSSSDDDFRRRLSGELELERRLDRGFGEDDRERRLLTISEFFLTGNGVD